MRWIAVACLLLLAMPAQAAKGGRHRAGIVADAPTTITDVLQEPDLTVQRITGGHWRLACPIQPGHTAGQTFKSILFLDLDRSGGSLDAWGTPTGVTVYGAEATVAGEPIVRQAVSWELEDALRSQAFPIGAIIYSADGVLAYDLDLSQFPQFDTLRRGVHWVLHVYPADDVSPTGRLGSFTGTDLP